ncbi:MAG: carboxylating nicotinate-nucleotide diphosphorylase [Planctomycetaceae bacterium]|nr:carboxylating nicotinate-nucleotide diphosphorylase [Planctomycetaceae bacterium]
MARKDYRPVEWDHALEDDLRHLIRLAVREDLDRHHDWTTAILVDDRAEARARVAARGDGTVAGMLGAKLVLEEYDARLQWTPLVDDGARVTRGAALAEIAGPARSLLTAERPLLNLLGRLSGIATLTREYVDAVAGTGARVYDTRKTMPGWRRIEKYAVRMGGGTNHRLGLYDGILIKDNHLAQGAEQTGATRFTPAEAVRHAKKFLAERCEAEPQARDLWEEMLVEIEVDRLDQLEQVLPERPDVVLLDNMTPDVLRQAVAKRDAVAPDVELEASGGVNLRTIRGIAASGVERISVGALTHSALWWDVGLDWL